MKEPAIIDPSKPPWYEGRPPPLTKRRAKDSSRKRSKQKEAHTKQDTIKLARYVSRLPPGEPIEINTEGEDNLGTSSRQGSITRSTSQPFKEEEETFHEAEMSQIRREQTEHEQQEALARTAEQAQSS